LRVKTEALVNLGRWDESLQTMGKVIEINPRNYDVIGRKGELLDMMGRFNESLQAFNQAIELIPASDTSKLAETWLLKGDVLNKTGSHEEALQAYDKAIEVNPIFGDAWRGRGEALKALGKVYDASMSFYMAQKLGYEEE